MSLLDTGTVVADVYVETATTDAYNNTVLTPGDTPVQVVGRLQPAGNVLGSDSEQANLGQVVDSRYRFISRTFPGGPFARVEVAGQVWDVLGSPKHHTGSPMTDHYTTTLKRRGALVDTESSSSSSSESSSSSSS